MAACDGSQLRSTLRRAQALTAELPRAKRCSRSGNHTIRKFLSNEERADTVVIGGVTALMAVSFILAVGVILFMN